MSIAGAPAVRAPTPDPAPQAGNADERRAEKSTRLEPYAPGGIERFLVAVEQRYLIERIFDPPRGFFTRVGGMPEGQGITAGPAYRYSTPAAAFTATSALSVFGAWEATARFDAPRGKPVASILHAEDFAVLVGRRCVPPPAAGGLLGPGSERRQRRAYDYLLDETSADMTGGLSPARWFTVAGAAEYEPNDRKRLGLDLAGPQAGLRRRRCRERGSIWTTSAGGRSAHRRRARTRGSAGRRSLLVRDEPVYESR